jgi:hypothetical protein
MKTVSEIEAARKLNGYDISFLRWFRDRGWMIRGVDVWCADTDNRCPFRLTRPMVQRLSAAGDIRRIYPDNAPIWLECYQ